jgi:hypothetical protein
VWANRERQWLQLEMYWWGLHATDLEISVVGGSAEVLLWETRSPIEPETYGVL